MDNHDKRLSRRAVLRGTGVALGLPLLESMTPLRGLISSAAAAATGVAAAKPPVRLAFLYVPGGVNVDEWIPTGEGPDYKPGFTLQALEPVRKHVLVLTGLDGRQGETGGNGHPLGCAPWLSSAEIDRRDRGGYATDISVDQIAARKIGASTRLPSLELGCDRDATQVHTSNISWRGPGSPMGKEVNPRSVFNRLFGDPGADGYQKSILDLVQEDAGGLRKKLGRDDGQKLDEYLDSVRSIEQRIEIAEKNPNQAPPPKIDLPDETPEDYVEHVRLLTDLIALGFQTDNTRVATFMFNNEAGRRSWPELGIREGHHELAHLDPRTADGKQKLDKLKRIDRAYVERFVHLIQKLASMPEGEGTVLDNCMLMYGSGLAWGRLHNRESLPILLAGGGGGTIAGGRHIKYPRSTPLANLYLSMLDRVGAPVERIADSTGPLKDLS